MYYKMYYKCNINVKLTELSNSSNAAVACVMLIHSPFSLACLHSITSGSEIFYHHSCDISHSCDIYNSALSKKPDTKRWNFPWNFHGDKTVEFPVEFPLKFHRIKTVEFPVEFPQDAVVIYAGDATKR